MTSDGEIEIRWFGGLRGDLAATGIAWDLGAVYYLEPEKDYVEPKLGLSHEFAGLPLMPRVSASVHYSPDFYLEAGNAVYVDGAVGMSLKGVLGGELPAQEHPDLRGVPAPRQCGKTTLARKLMAHRAALNPGYRCLYLWAQPEAQVDAVREPLAQVAAEWARHSGMDCRNPEHMDVGAVLHPGPRQSLPG